MIKFFLGILVLFSIFAVVSANAKSLSPVVQTASGPVQGWNGENTEGVFSFKGIPYAEPPVGKLRFADTVPAASWNGTKTTTTFSAGCMAYCPSNAFPRPDIMCTPTISEDCLYLNVFTPTLSTSANLDVIMFMHGGNFQFGAGGVILYDGSELAQNENVVVVTINYRLNVFGGLYTGRVKGNFQIKDQREAMKWISRNIASFGGNPKSVSISGQSAGAFSTSTHMVSPKSWPYFQRAFSISNPLGLMASTPEIAMELANIVLKNVSCPQSGSDEQLECLRSVPAEALLAASNNRLPPIPSQAFMMMMDWVPVVDGDELPNQPITALTTGQFNRVPFLVSTVANESLQFIYDISTVPLDKFALEILIMLVLDNQTLVNDAVAEYGPIPNIPDERHWVSPMITDLLFYCPWRYAGRAIAQTGNPIYEWIYDNQNATWNQWVYGSAMPYCAPNYINCHAIDLASYFSPINAIAAAGISPPHINAGERKLMRNYQTALANFMKTGNPNLPKAVPVTFPLMNQNGKQVNMTENIAILDNYRGNYCDFWDNAGYRRF